MLGLLLSLASPYAVLPSRYVPSTGSMRGYYQRKNTLSLDALLLFTHTNAVKAHVPRCY